MLFLPADCPFDIDREIPRLDREQLASFVIRGRQDYAPRLLAYVYGVLNSAGGGRTGIATCIIV